MKALAAIVVMCVTATGASAETAVERALHVGLQLTSDTDTSRARVGGGVRFGGVKLAAVVDVPMLSGNDTVDAIVEVGPGSRAWSLLAGWRVCAISIDRGTQWQEVLLVGASGRLPALFDGRIQPSFGGELAFTVVRHGAMLETDWISFASQRHALDTISANLFLRIDYETPL